jgi:hypothetical protein
MNSLPRPSVTLRGMSSSNKRSDRSFVRHCYECHSGASNEVKGSLRLDYRDAVLKGGDSGPVLKAGSPDDSLLLSAIRHEGLEMPPGKKLTAAEIKNVEEWIRSGAFDPRDHRSRPQSPSQPKPSKRCIRIVANGGVYNRQSLLNLRQ